VIELLRDPEIWIAVSFVAFLLLAAKPIYRAIAKSLDERAERIRADLAEAERLRREAEALLADYQARQRASADEAAAILARARDEAETLKKEATRNLAALLQRRERMALDKIAQAEVEAKAAVKARAVDLAVAAAQRILEQQASAGPLTGRLVDQAIGELERKLH
jgi:F-type H+-transporting ATPase subunit b